VQPFFLPLSNTGTGLSPEPRQDDRVNTTAPWRSFGTRARIGPVAFAPCPLDLSAAALDELASALRSNAAAFSDLLARRQQPTAITR
jgi:hypothetical protein